MVLLSVNVCPHLFEDPDSQHGSELEDLFKIHAETCPRLVRMPIVYLRKYLALGRAPIYFERNSEKWLGLADCLGRTGCSAEWVDGLRCPDNGGPKPSS